MLCFFYGCRHGIYEQAYLDKSFYKTASLIAASCRSSAIFSGVEEDVKSAMYEYGRHLGLAFQVVDDILDFTRTTEQLGKPQVRHLLQRAQLSFTLSLAEGSFRTSTGLTLSVWIDVFVRCQFVAVMVSLKGLVLVLFIKQQLCSDMRRGRTWPVET